MVHFLHFIQYLGYFDIILWIILRDAVSFSGGWLGTFMASSGDMYTNRPSGGKHSSSCLNQSVHVMLRIGRHSCSVWAVVNCDLMSNGIVCDCTCGERGNAKMHILYGTSQHLWWKKHILIIFNLYHYDKHQLQTPKGLWDKTRNRLKEHSSN